MLGSLSLRNSVPPKAVCFWRLSLPKIHFVCSFERRRIRFWVLRWTFDRTFVIPCYYKPAAWLYFLHRIPMRQGNISVCPRCHCRDGCPQPGQKCTEPHCLWWLLAIASGGWLGNDEGQVCVCYFLQILSKYLFYRARYILCVFNNVFFQPGN